MPDKPAIHVLGLSGGKDSAALAVYMRDRVPQMRYFFADTGAELPETYEYLDHLEQYLGKGRIDRLHSGRDFDHWLDIYRGTLPSPQMRWCTRQMKIKPFEDWIDRIAKEEQIRDHEVFTYVAIRADEPSRQGYISTRPNIHAVYPFKEDGIDNDGVKRILRESGLDLPKYYEWRTRSGCYFCFFQRKAEWVGLAERYPELFDKAVAYEDKVNWESRAMDGRQYTWSQGETLHELIDRKDEILAKHEEARRLAESRRKNRPLIEIFTGEDLLADALDEDDDTLPCQVCHL